MFRIRPKEQNKQLEKMIIYTKCLIECENDISKIKECRKTLIPDKSTLAKTQKKFNFKI